MSDHIFEYTHNGQLCGFTLPASDKDDAIERLRSIRRTGQYTGRLNLSVIVPGWLRLPSWRGGK